MDYQHEARAIIHSIIQREQDRSGYSESWVRKNRVALVNRAIDSGEIANIYQELSNAELDALIDAITSRLR